MRYSLDTDTISEILKDKNEIIRIRYNDSLLVGDDVYINAISYYEIRRGFLYQNHIARSQKFEEICKECDLIMMDDIAIFEKAAEIHAGLRKNKKEIGR